MSRSPRRRQPPVFDRARCADRLAEGIAALGVAIESRAREQLLDYLDALTRWNATHNLTAVREPSDMVARHLLDCLAIVDHVVGPRVADVGSGPGLPGLVLATARPGLDVTLVEANRKKIAFLRHARRVLDLDNVSIVATRAEAWAPDNRFDWVVTRAFAEADRTVAWAGHLVAADGRLALMKARDPADELAGLAPGTGFTLEADHPIRVPGLDARRRLLVMTRAPAS